MKREGLLAICEAAFVPQDKWRNRDSSAAQQQVGECYSMLRAGCDFWVREDEKQTLWVTVEYHGFDYFEYGSEEGCCSSETYYLPTRARLDQVAGKDWY